MNKRTRVWTILTFAFLAGCSIGNRCFGQTGEFETVVIDGGSPHLFFEPNNGDNSWFLKFPDKLIYNNSGGSPNLVIDDSAPKASFTIDSIGAGVGTYDPSAPLHVFSDDNATRGYSNARIRIENDKSAYFKREMFEMLNHGPVSMRMYDTSTSRNWAIMGGANGGQFQLRDTGFVALAVNDYEEQEYAGFVGVGTLDPQSKLHIYTASEAYDAGLLIENNQNSTALRTMFELVNNGPSSFEFSNTASGQTWSFQTNASDNFMINRLGSGGNEFSIRKNGMVTMGPGGQINFRLAPNGNLQIAGTLSELSDRNAKEAFQRVDTTNVLDKVCELPITTWRYKDESENIRHMGPMAQDFYKAFGLGENETSISSVDKNGVALAAIQALNNKLESELQAKDDRIAELEDRLAQQSANQESRIDQLESQLAQLTAILQSNQ